MTDVLVPAPAVIVKIGTFLIGQRLIGQPLAGDVWNDNPLLLPSDTAELTAQKNPLVPGPADTYADWALVLPADTADLKLGTTVRLLVDVDYPLVLPSDQATIHFDAVLVVFADAVLVLDGGQARVNPKLITFVCEDLDLVAAGCTDLVLVAAGSSDLDLDPLACLEG